MNNMANFLKNLTHMCVRTRAYVYMYMYCMHHSMENIL